eukprot:TRINITY_DN11445_c0_g1_i1.p1 TRINITY_DN11445_c0_g1~~TRINITY_DN11445_c0_g1_i1.p1  ORF type:complete len:431 (+),score=34.28 TRINITY_DN11445_c0_g1_i1:142-1293(+)
MHSRIGTSGDGQGGISTGERKRVTIACELVVNPLVLLMDEPTSGLDSYNATLLMEVIKKMAKTRGLLCIFSIHQPPSAVYNMFDRLVLLTKLGTLAYSGPASEVLNYLQKFKFPIPEGPMNVAEHLLSLSSNKDTKSVEQLSDTFRSSQEIHDLLRELDAFVAQQFEKKRFEEPKLESPGYTVGSPGYDDEPRSVASMESAGSQPNDTKLTTYSASNLKVSFWSKNPPRRGGVSIFWQCIYLSSRGFSHLWRDPSLLRFTYIFCVVCACILGGLFYQLHFDFAGTQDRAGLLFFLIFLFSLTSLSLLARHMEEKERFLQERERGYYGDFAYLMSKIVCDIFPLRTIPPLIFGCIVYDMIGLKDKIGRAVQQECRDRSRMPSSA